MLCADGNNRTVVLETILVILHWSDVHVDLLDTGIQSDWFLDPLLTNPKASIASISSRSRCTNLGTLCAQSSEKTEYPKPPIFTDIRCAIWTAHHLEKDLAYITASWTFVVLHFDLGSSSAVICVPNLHSLLRYKVLKVH